MKQLTNKLDFSLTKKRLVLMGKKSPLIKLFGLLSLVIPVTASLVFMFCTNTEYEPISLSFEELQANLPPTTYHDIELESEGTTGLFHPLDERTGIFLGPDGEPYTGERTTFDIETDSVLYRQTMVDGKVSRTEFPQFDLDGVYQHQVVVIPSLDSDGNKVSTHYDFLSPDSMIQSLRITDRDSVTVYEQFHPNGELAFYFQIIPEHGIDGLATTYDEQGAIKEQRLYYKGEIVETIVELE
ncbi:MAG: hypothetical protein JJ895_06375 [Balneolaceae bacterium]|nr:hypothetical protein [Balneolaceae bacterium]